MAKPFFAMALDRPKVTDNSADDLWHMHRRGCQNPTQLWLPPPEQRMPRQETLERFPGFPVGVATPPKPPHSPRSGPRACPPYLRPRAPASPGLPPRACCAVGAALPQTRDEGAGSPGARGRGGPAGAQVSSFIHTRTGRPRGQRRQLEEARRKMRLLPCLRVTTASPVRPGPPKAHLFPYLALKKKQQPPRSDCGVFIPPAPGAPQRGQVSHFGERAYPRLTSLTFSTPATDPRVCPRPSIDPLRGKAQGRFRAAGT